MKFKEILIAALLVVLISFLYTSWQAHQAGTTLIDLESRISPLEQFWLKR